MNSRKLNAVSLISQILPNLQGGGAERVSINLANEWANLGYVSEFALMDRRGELLSAVAPGIAIHNLNSKRVRQVPRKLLAYFRERRPDITLAHMWPLTSVAVLAWRLAGSPGQLFLCEHVGLTDHVQRDLSTPLSVVKATLRLSYPFASGVVAVSQGAALDLASLTGLPASSIRVIHNPVVASELLQRRPTDTAEREQLWHGAFCRNLISIGSLKTQKNHLLLIEAFAELAKDQDAGLVILGEGPQRPKLEQRIQELGLNQRVRLPGFDANPDPWLRAADLFVLSSDFEGLPTVLIEALAAGTPVVSTACPHGPDEILEQGRHGVLVPIGDCAGLAHGIRTALSRRWDTAALQRRSLDFSIPRQASAYLELFGCPQP